ELRGDEARLAGPEPHAAGRAAVQRRLAAISAVRAAPGVALAICGGLWPGAGAGAVWIPVLGPAAGHDGGHGLGGDANPGLLHAAAGRAAAGRARPALAVVGPAARLWRPHDDWPGARRRTGPDDVGRFCVDAGRRVHVGGVQPG